LGGDSLDWLGVWGDVAQQVADHRAAGRRHLLTEDTVRLCTVLALERAGVAPSRLKVEVPEKVLRGGKLDLVLDHVESTHGAAGRTVIELKYPRGSRTGISPDTMTLGELLRDFLRVALVQADVRWVVALLEPKFRGYLGRRDTLGWVSEPGKQLTLGRELLQALPKTALDAIGAVPWLLPVTSTCVVATPVDVDLALLAYRVDAPAADTVPSALVASSATTAIASGLQSPQGAPATGTAVTVAPPRGARAAIIEAINALTARSGRPEVSTDDVIGELRRAGSMYAASTIRTMMVSHMCRQSQGPGILTFEDLDRVDRGVYRLVHRPLEDP